MCETESEFCLDLGHCNLFSVAYLTFVIAIMRLQNEMCYFWQTLEVFPSNCIDNISPLVLHFLLHSLCCWFRVDLFFELTVKDHRNSHGHQNHVSCERVYDNNHKSISGLITKKYFVFWYEKMC